MVLKQLFRKKMHFRGSEVETGMREKGVLGLEFSIPLFILICTRKQCFHEDWQTWSELADWKARVEMNLERSKLNLIHVLTALKACGLHTENICFCWETTASSACQHIFLMRYPGIPWTLEVYKLASWESSAALLEYLLLSIYLYHELDFRLLK